MNHRCVLFVNVDPHYRRCCHTLVSRTIAHVAKVGDAEIAAIEALSEAAALPRCVAVFNLMDGADAEVKTGLVKLRAQGKVEAFRERRCA